MGIRDISPPERRYSAAERDAARLSLAKSRFFLILGLGTQMGSEQNPIPSTICTCARPDAVLKVVTLQSKDKQLSRDNNARICIELKGRQSSKARVAAANRIVSAVGSLFTLIHPTNCQEFLSYQIEKGLISGTSVQVEALEQLESLTRSADMFLDAFMEKIRSYLIISDSATARIFTCFRSCFRTRTCLMRAAFFARVVRSTVSWVETPGKQRCASPNENRPTKLNGWVLRMLCSNRFE